MREDISDPRKLAAKADEIWPSSYARSVKTVSAASPPLPAQDDVLNALCQRPQLCPAPCVAPSPTPSTAHPPAPSSAQNSDLCW